MAFDVDPDFAPVLESLGLDEFSVFVHPRIVCWRKLSDRENCTLDLPDELGGGRWHIKRYPAARNPPACAEVAGLRLLTDHQIPTMRCVGSGVLQDRRSFIITQNLRDHLPGDQFIAGKHDIAVALASTCNLAARLHLSGLHHRDLYLCHFFIHPATGDIRLIDVARVRKLPRLFAQRWIIKDLAQFWYSSLKLPISDAQRDNWLDKYCQQTSASPASLKPKILAKVARIARHDVKLNQRQPSRHNSIPTS